MSKKQWYAKSTYLLVALALVLSLGVVAVPMAGTVEANLGTHYYVATTGSDAYTPAQAQNPATPWKTISHAATTVPAGASSALPNVIEVAAGLYDTTSNGEIFPITFGNDNVVVLGAGVGNAIIDANNQEVNIVEIGTDSVDISGFTLRNAKAKWWGSTGNAIYMDEADNCNISNLEIYNLTEGTSQTREPAGIFIDNASYHNTFSSIEIYDISSVYPARGIYMWHNSDYNTFTDINIHDLSNTCDSVVFGIHVDGSSGVCDNNQFDSIEIHRLTGGDWAEGIELQESPNNTFGDLSISDVAATYHAYGIKLGESSYNTFGSNSEIWNISAESGCGIGIGVERDNGMGSNNNIFTSFDIHDTCWGFYIHESDDNIITKSNIHDNVQGVYINSITVSEGNKINCNNIYRNTDYGVYKENPPDVDSTGNWWGDAHGPSLSPGNGDEISANVLYDPYLSFEFQYCEQCGGTLPQPTAVPTVNHWGIAAMITLFAGLLVWRVRRRRLAS